MLNSKNCDGIIWCKVGRCYKNVGEYPEKQQLEKHFCTFNTLYTLLV